jgi:hypothetical protein
MVRRTYCILALFVCIAALCGTVRAQAVKPIIIKMLDGRTGKLVATTGFMVRINHEETVHANWVVQNEDGTGTLTLPLDASILTIQGTYDSSMEVYLNCDAGAKTETSDHWYTVSDILATGVVAPNGCGKQKAAAKPGEFVFYVRRQNWRELMKELSSH